MNHESFFRKDSPTNKRKVDPSKILAGKFDQDRIDLEAFAISISRHHTSLLIIYTTSFTSVIS